MKQIKLLAAGIIWRVAGVPAAGNALVDAVLYGDESEREMAGMLLVKAGNRTRSLIGARFTPWSGVAPTQEILDVLASITAGEPHE